MRIHPNKGFALPAAIAVMGILAVLGTALWQMGMADALQSVRIERKVQAEYIARSAAESFARYLADNPEEIEERLEEEGIGDLGRGTFSVHVREVQQSQSEEEQEDIFSSVYHVVATGVVEGISHTAVLGLTRGGLFDGVAIYANVIDVVGATTPEINTNPDGGVYTPMSPEDFGSEQQIEQVFVGPGPVNWGKTIPYTDLDFPDSSSWPAYEGQKLTENTRGGDVSLQGRNGNLRVDLEAAGGQVDMVVDSFEGRGNANVYLEGSGTFVLWVYDHMDFTGNFHSDVSWKDSELVIILSGDGTRSPGIRIGGTANFNGAVYAPNRDVTIDGNALVQGSIIADSLRVAGIGANPMKFIYKKLESSAFDGQGSPMISNWLRPAN